MIFWFIRYFTENDGVKSGARSDVESPSSDGPFRPLVAALGQARQEMRAVNQLERGLDQIIAHLDDLDRKCDAKLDELTKKRKAYLEATMIVQSAFKK